MTENDYFADMRVWQKSMDAELRAEDGWLTLVGLHWLHIGENSVGSNPSKQVLLPEGAPDTVGTLTLLNEKDVVFETAPGVTVRIDGKEFTGKTPLQSDANRNQTIIEVGTISFYIVVRGIRTGVRVKQSDSPSRVNFSGRVWWPVDEAMRITARVNYYDPQKNREYPRCTG